MCLFLRLVFFVSQIEKKKGELKGGRGRTRHHWNLQFSMFFVFSTKETSWTFRSLFLLINDTNHQTIIWSPNICSAQQAMLFAAAAAHVAQLEAGKDLSFISAPQGDFVAGAGLVGAPCLNRAVRNKCSIWIWLEANLVTKFIIE